MAAFTLWLIAQVLLAPLIGRHMGGAAPSRCIR